MEIIPGEAAISFPVESGEAISGFEEIASLSLCSSSQ
jgi:hypothetical protein